MTTTKSCWSIALGCAVLLMGAAGTLVAQPAPVTLDNVPKRRLLETIQKAPADQVFLVRGKRMTKRDIANQAKATQDQLMAQLPSIRATMAELHKKSARLVVERRAAQKAELDAANARAMAGVQAFLAGK